MGVMAVALVAGMSVKSFADEGLLNKVKERGTLLVGLAQKKSGIGRKFNLRQKLFSTTAFIKSIINS